MSVPDVSGGTGGVESRYADFQKIHRREISDLGARGLLPARGKGALTPGGICLPPPPTSLHLLVVDQTELVRSGALRGATAVSVGSRCFVAGTIRENQLRGASCEIDCRRSQLMSVLRYQRAPSRCSLAYATSARLPPRRILTGDTTETLCPISDFRTSTKSTLLMSGDYSQRGSSTRASATRT